MIGLVRSKSDRAALMASALVGYGSPLSAMTLPLGAVSRQR